MDSLLLPGRLLPTPSAILFLIHMNKSSNGASIKFVLHWSGSPRTQNAAMEKAGGDEQAARAAAGGMCDRLLTFLSKNLSMARPQKSITDGPTDGGAGAGAGGVTQTEEGGKEGNVEEDEFTIKIERAEFELSDGGDAGHGGVTTLLEDASTEAAPAAADTDRPPAAAAAAVEETTKVKKTVTIKEEAAGDKGAPAPAPERKKSMFKKRQASSSASVGGGGGGEEEQAGGGRPVRRSGLRPRMPEALRVPSNINERSSTFIEQRKRSFFRGTGKPAAAPEK
ncbi:hypothetical protein ACP4OV_002229 [Aristida adscensionis]